MEQQIKAILAAALGIPLENITDSFAQQDASQWDSLNHLNLMVDLETCFDISFEPEEILEMDSLQKVIRYCKMKTGTE